MCVLQDAVVVRGLGDDLARAVGVHTRARLWLEQLQACHSRLQR